MLRELEHALAVVQELPLKYQKKAAGKLHGVALLYEINSAKTLHELQEVVKRRTKNATRK